MWLAVHAGRIGSIGVVYLRGELDLATQPQLEQGLRSLVEAGCWQLVVDFEAIQFADLGGLGVLIRVRRRLRAGGGWLRLAAPPPGVLRLLALTDLDLPVYPDVYAAITDADRMPVVRPRGDGDLDQTW
ncbi:STAS domain-containing protein [Pseudofrankia inefficax]|uniref:Anti-sigma factor antagonist n=1 Tax=Pseudofrankia inefficax (strain DSM 45817 / CECT 9037 / DDB 130130 / EuI1c) TaxID=298654 RepID=E3J8E1_PSEI1|nr:STAS domain-containing protein [Pseudofrankia inefficax]ADP84475.1 anti-anti-sigma factor [Pseudofrankia inefficax]